MLSSHELFRDFSTREFTRTALEIFRFQAENNTVYRSFLKYLNTSAADINSIEDIPFMPISFFKYFSVISSEQSVNKIFTSSGTTADTISKHFVTDLDLYHQQLAKSFEHFYGDFKSYEIYPLLPAYAERTGSSLIEMVDFWMKKTGQSNREYYLYDHAKLASDLLQKKTDKRGIIIGVSFALLDFAGKFPLDLSEFIIIETGGMKGRKEEMTRKELHGILKKAFNSEQIHSEYGMTELLSQAYAKENGIFQTPPWMKILLRDPEDPFSYVNPGKTGGINVIDFANINSCSFIATDDLGRFSGVNNLEILGRFDNSDVRGCNLLAV